MDLRAGRDDVLRRARELTARTGRTVVDVPDLVLALIDCDPGLRAELEGRGADLEQLRHRLAAAEPPPRRVDHAFADEVRPGDTSISSSGARLVRALNGNADPGSVIDIMSNHGLQEYLPPVRPPDSAGSAPAPTDTDTDTDTGSGRPNRPVPSYTVDLTELGAAGAIDPVIARDDVIDRVVRVLHRRRKPNPLLVGPPGVGKTAIVEGLAARLATGMEAPRLQGTRILSVDFASMISGTRFRGEFEGRLRQLLEDVAADPRRPILFIDEVQVVLGTGRAEGGMDAASILLPALARGQLGVIGATTPAEYEKYFAADTALARRFEPVFVHEPDADTAVEILRGLRAVYEKHHGVEVCDAVIRAAVAQSVAGAPARHLPDKAIDLLDEACALVASRTTGSHLRVSEADITAVSRERGWVPRREGGSA